MTVDDALKLAVRDGVALAYLDIGVGAPPLLFIHGWCCDRTYWREQLLAFQDRHWTVAVDLRGHGASDKPDQDYGI
ncbi:MAG TPA: alpha/beta hydrolase, partial [Dehalococcoidia bacterium]|nr:alpha/beta hydrolase [Dehalococcoidia bacterium]